MRENKKKFNKKLIISLSVSFIIILYSILRLPGLGVVDFTNYNISDTGGNIGEITTGTIVEVEIPRLFKYLDSIEIQSANYDNRENAGILNIRVFNDNEINYQANIDISNLIDGEYIKIPLKNYSSESSMIKIIITAFGCDSGKAITLFNSNNSVIGKIGGTLKINDELSDKSLNIKINHKQSVFSKYALLIILIVVWIFFIINMDYAKQMLIRMKTLILKNKISCFLFTLAFIVITMRYLEFIKIPSLYGEDGIYLNNIYSQGILKSMFKTRSGNGADFLNFGSYILLYLSSLANSIIFGNDITKLPIIIGLISNAFYSFTATFSYNVFKKINKVLAFLIYISTILVPVNISGSEIFGRVLNTVFIWPVLILLILFNDYSKKYYLGLPKLISGVICIIAGTTFPISYGVIAVYLIYTFIQAIVDNEIFNWAKANCLLLVCLFIGIIGLPNMIQSQGITESMVFKYESLIEFSIARHILYPFIYLIYGDMNDYIIIAIFAFYLCLVLSAVAINTSKKGIFNSFNFMVLAAFTIIISSIIMRARMTELFNFYQNTYPDRYFYGCNLTSMILLYTSFFIIINRKKKKIRLEQIVCMISVINLLGNEYLFETHIPKLNIFQNSDKKSLSECISETMNNENFVIDELRMVKIRQYPHVPETNWNINIPLKYILSTDSNYKDSIE